MKMEEMRMVREEEDQVEMETENGEEKVHQKHQKKER